MIRAHLRSFAMLVAVALASPALGQFASATLVADEMRLAPGESTTVRLVITFDNGGQPAGPFGLGLHGFGGDVVGSGAASDDLAVSGPALDSTLVSGTYLSTTRPGVLLRAAAGRGLLAALNTDPVDAVSFTVTAAPSASGSATLTFAGAVVLALDDALVTFSTDPGVNQNALAVSPLILSIDASCNAADLAAPFGSLTFADISAFLGAFSTSDPAADLAAPIGSFTFADISAFLAAFSAGCP
jgi:hypothetical protein